MNREEYEKNLFERIISVMKKYGLENLAKALILTGSFGRGEATYYSLPDGMRLKSDIEIVVVFSGHKKEIKRFINKVTSEFSEDLNLMPITEKRIQRIHNFNGGFLIPKRKTLFTYDLYNMSKTIWGEDYLSSRRVSLSEVDLYEAKRIAANRIGELIYISEEKPENRVIWKSKLMLAAGSGYLLLKKKYSASYKAQAKALESIKYDTDKELGCSFFEDYNAAFEFLRGNGKAAELSDDNMRIYIKNLYSLFNQFELKKSSVNSLGRYVKYVIKYLKSAGVTGIYNFEDRILDSLLTGYIANDKDILNTARLWHRVLY